MARKQIPDNIKRRLWAESMGRCMNPNCQKELFINHKDIAEQAHIVPYNKTQDHSFENLIILCPNCHTIFDKVDGFDINNIRNWKKIRKEEVDKYFSKKFSTFKELEKNIVPLLTRNMEIYDNYFLEDNKTMWDEFEDEILINNDRIKNLLEKNIELIQDHKYKDYSNRAIINEFISHIKEFSRTRNNKGARTVLYPSKVNSIFGIEPIYGKIIPSVEALENLIKKLKDEGITIHLELTDIFPHIELQREDKTEIIHLEDTARLRQFYANYNTLFSPTNMRLDSLIYIMKYIKSRKIPFSYKDTSNIKEIRINNINIIFVYQYCLSKKFLEEIMPDEGSVIVNLHHWNGNSCISSEAKNFAKTLNVTLLTKDDFYEFANQFK